MIPYIGILMAFLFIYMTLGLPDGSRGNYYITVLILLGIQAAIVSILLTIRFFSDSDACWDKAGYKIYSVIIPIGLVLIPTALTISSFIYMNQEGNGLTT